MAMTIITHIIV